MRGLLAFSLFLAGCELFGTSTPAGRPVTEAYAGGHELRVLDIDSPLRPQKKVPVLSTPEVFAVYVPSHVQRDVMIGEHWLFFKLKDAEWFIEKLQEGEPPTTGDAPVEQLKPVKELDWNKIVIPHKN